MKRLLLLLPLLLTSPALADLGPADILLPGLLDHHSPCGNERRQSALLVCERRINNFWLCFAAPLGGPHTREVPTSGSEINPAGFAPANEGNAPTTSEVEAKTIKVLMVKVMSIGNAIGGRGIPSAANTIPGFIY